MLHLCVQKLLLLVGVCMAQAEWIKITQEPQSPSTTATPKIKPVVNIGNYATLAEQDLNTPSPEWIAYQHERFGNSSVNKLIVSALPGDLKNSAHIVVPANVQIFKAKTKLEVKSTPADIKVFVIPKVETTSRRDMDHENVAEQIEDSENANAAHETPTPDNNLQFPSIQGFLNFLKTVQDSWLKKSANSIEQKINLLTQLRDNLMKVIEDKFNLLWPSVEERRLRRKRGIFDESNLNFPPEVSIMTINFLTFAVFLIKLVLQVVDIVKSKHYNLSGFNINSETT